MAKGRAYSRDKKAAATVVDNYLRQWRQRKTKAYPEGMSQGTLSAISGVPVSSISAYERGDTDPSVEALRKLGAALNIPGGMILDVDPTKDPSLWDSWQRANPTERDAMSRMAAGLVPAERGRKTDAI